ncbi:MAG TPA: putative DNA-binding domain-containing protein [Steroidobacteraceae bacterium]|nr:putative DNA-binding domain-containing protein [Steroidobacteraceae bacterium]
MNHQEVQRAFAAHLRDPQRHPAPPGMEERRVAVYRELFFNNVSSLLGSTFPVLRLILGEARWRALVRDFYASHPARTPLFLEVPREMVEYLVQERTAQPDDPPFMAELAHYEWVELALGIDPTEIPDSGFQPEGDLLEGTPLLSPLAWPLAYRFPVQRLSPDFQPESAPREPTLLVACRRRDDQVKFAVINALTARLLELMQEGGEKSGRELLSQLAKETSRPQAGSLIQAGSAVLEELRRAQIVLGSRARNS